MKKKERDRKAYCTGCGIDFGKHHKLINHRRSFRCGGRYLSPEERESFDKLRLERERQDRNKRAIAALVKDIEHGRVFQ